MDQIYLCPRCGEPMRTHRLACWLRLVQPIEQNPDNLCFQCRGCGAPFALPRDTPLAAA
ncbi:hypothetical protein [Anaeromyxobacter sp. SG26]|uniref:hypothetical protein n=1 Tax=Anaeromyxobacter sp. SG26 TaxID=2925407 RepID=UPI001F597A3B|nr:hypothetical protein [Anaeromyxobacter sp. SG26]